MRRSQRQKVKTAKATDVGTSSPSPAGIKRKFQNVEENKSEHLVGKRRRLTKNYSSLKTRDPLVRISHERDFHSSIQCNFIKATQSSEKIKCAPALKNNTNSHQSEEVTRQPEEITIYKHDVGETLDESKENAQKCSSTDSDVEQEEYIHYLNIREQNIKANEEFFASLGLNKAKEKLHLSISGAKKKSQPTQRGLKVNKEPQEPLSRRYSLRIRHIDPLGKPLPDPEPVPETRTEVRLPTGPLLMKECAYSKNETTSDQHFQDVVSLVCQQKPQKMMKVSTNNKVFNSALELVTITENRVAKVVPGRVFSLAWHPSSHSLICVAGDKYGHIGLWDLVTNETGDRYIVRAFKPHTKPVNDLFIPHADPHKLYSCSYDSTLRCGNFEKEVFNEVFSVPEENDDLFRNFNFIDSTNTMLVSQSSGNVSLVDTRTPSTSAEHVYPVSEKSLRTVSVHPKQPHYFISAGVDTTISLWDLRSISKKSPKPVQKLEDHTRAISSAYFSPTGHKILSCSDDNTLNIYSVSDGMKLELHKRVHHNNFTGRWLTKFRPTWHPTVDDVFVSGSMIRPRQIEVFSGDGHLVKALTNEDFLGSVCSLNVFHPGKTCTLVGANSSGRLHVFM